MKKITLMVLVIFFSYHFTYSQTKQTFNIVLVIANGLGMSHLNIANQTQELNILKMPYIGLTTTNNADNQISDNWASITALSTGCKTKNNYSAIDKNGQKKQSILEIASKQGKRTILITSGSLVSYGLPAFTYKGFVEKNFDSVANSFHKSGLSIFVGKGRRYFNKNTLIRLEKSKYVIKYDLKVLKKRKRRSLALILPETQILKNDFLNNVWVDGYPNFVDFYNNGFFTVIQNPKIQEAIRERDSKQMIQEIINLDKAVGSIIKYAGNQTLVLVVSNVVTGCVSVNKNNKKINWHNNANNSEFAPVFAYGKYADEFSGFYDNTQIFNKLKDILDKK